MNQHIDGSPLYQNMYAPSLSSTQPPMLRVLTERLASKRGQLKSAEQLAGVQQTHPGAMPASFCGGNIIVADAAALSEQLRAEIGQLENEVAGIEFEIEVASPAPEPSPKERLEYLQHLRDRREGLIRAIREAGYIREPVNPAWAIEQAEVEGEISRLESAA